MVDQSRRSLNSGVCQFAYFLTVKFIPPFAVKFQTKFSNELSVNEVDESVPDVARIVGIYRQVEKVVFQLMILVYLIYQHLLSVLVRNVSDHECSAAIVLNLNKK